MIRTSQGEGLYAAGEVDVVAGALPTWLGTQTRGVVWCHGSGELATDAALNWRRQIKALGQYATVHVGDLAGQTWGSDTVVTRIGQAITALQGHGVTGKVALVGMSMGGCSALNYAVRYPENVACVAGLIPLLDLANVRANPLLASRYAEIDAIYGAPPTTYTTHNPVEFVGDLPDDMPIHLWTSSNDTLAVPSTADAFVAARPQTGRTSMGAVGHTITDATARPLARFVVNQLLAAS